MSLLIIESDQQDNSINIYFIYNISVFTDFLAIKIWFVKTLSII